MVFNWECCSGCGDEGFHGGGLVTLELIEKVLHLMSVCSACTLLTIPTAHALPLALCLLCSLLSCCSQSNQTTDTDAALQLAAGLLGCCKAPIANSPLHGPQGSFMHTQSLQVISRGSMVMASDFSLKALIKDWQVTSR